MDLKLIDFGMAKCVDAGLPARTGTFDGSPSLPWSHRAGVVF